MSDNSNIRDLNVNPAASPPEENAGDWFEDMKSAVLAQNWWVVALRGALGVAFGLTAIFLPGVTLLSLVLVFCAYMLADGVLAIIMAVRQARRGEQWLVLAGEGVLRIAAGALAFMWPKLTIFAFVLLVAVWAIISGVMMITSAFRLKQNYGRIWLTISGVCSVLLGILLVAAPPVGALVLTFWMGIYAVVFGVALVVLAFRLREHRYDHIPASGGTAVPA
ncbi:MULTISPECIES: HdeD family acid-resistance protein [Rhodomicrobium]|uniref:HdeD family acid-resistance protein n=1 Tax=Rhodomicrobium TaxID=1068 RepID=UPI001FDA68AA|nr:MULTISPECIES: HdeD family acid-resistance protein [Rhodomicrobium]